MQPGFLLSKVIIESLDEDTFFVVGLEEINVDHPTQLNQLNHPTPTTVITDPIFDEYS